MNYFIEMEDLNPNVRERIDEVDAVQILRANPDAKFLKSLVENQALGTKKRNSHKGTIYLFKKWYLIN